MFRDKTLLVTGGTGSFGNAVVRRFLDSDIKEIRIFSRDEKKQEDMRITYADPTLKFYIGDVRNPESLRDAMQDVDYVFHAAALKQVPSCEFFPTEATRTNVIGTDNVLNAAIASGVSSVICLSTDKAVYPINAMGISKALMEKTAVAKARASRNTTISVTRYGNVMASRGSVIPLFINQLREGKPLTLTDPSMTRFMMSLEDAVDLVLFAFEHGCDGDIFVQKAPAATLQSLAEAICDLFGHDRDMLRVIGTRHGEKLYESLLTREERLHAEDMGEYYRVPMDSRDLNYANYVSEGEANIAQLEDYTSHNTERLDVEGMKDLLLKLDYVQASLAGGNPEGY
jgi:UDP-glucose 4-epimerase